MTPGIRRSIVYSLPVDLISIYSRYSRKSAAFDKTGLLEDNVRYRVAGFGHRQASRAAWSAKKQAGLVSSFTKRMEESGYKVTGFSKYYGDSKTLEEMGTAFEKMAHLYPEESKGITIDFRGTKEEGTLGWFSPKDRVIHFNRDYFSDWDKLMKEYQDGVNTGFFTAGTDPRACFYHEFGHAFGQLHSQKSYRKTVDEVLKEMGYGNMTVALRKSAIKKELSEYASTETIPAYQEVIAECFAEWYNSDRPRKFCDLFLRKAGAI